tara:strand:+ start:135 stop:719 length:585 start_codon:yes stop_codon:yes gene_type:complete
LNLNLKEYKLPVESFIQGWYMKESTCDDIINLFNDRKEHWTNGMMADKIQPDKKKSIELSIDKNEAFDEPLLSYRTQLQWCLEQYVKIYPELMMGGFFNINANFNIQHYNINEGFNYYHYERDDLSTCSRNLVFMTYLNDVEDGGTQFKYQNLITPAKKGLTLIWPTDFTHTHRGVISKTKEKYIATGWYSYSS